MNKNEVYIDLIDRYLQDKLSKEELIEFNRMLDSNHEFSKCFFEMDQLVSGIRYSARTSTAEEKLAKLESFLPPLEPAIREQNVPSGIFVNLSERISEYINELGFRLTLSTRQVKYALSGIAVTLSVSIVVLINLLRNPSPVVLFADNFKPPMYENFGNSRGTEVESLLPETVLFHEAMARYNAKDYPSASEIIHRIPAEKLDPEMSLYQALIQIQLENYGLAKDILKGLHDAGDSYWANEAKWYLSLSLVREKNYEDAISLLTQVRDGGGNHEKEAGKLLKKLK